MPLLAPYILHGAGGGSSYTETGVVADGSAWLTASAAYASDIRSALFFASYITDHNGSRQIFSGWGTGSNTDVFHADFNASDGAVAVRFDIEDSAGNSVLCNVPIATSNTARIHALVSVYNDGTGLYATMSVWDSDGEAWVSDPQSDTTFASAGFLTVDSATAPRLFQDASSVNNEFVGTSYRNAAWMKTTASRIADPTNGTVQGYFVSGGSGTAIEDPATSQAQYGTSGSGLIYDFNGSATDYNNGTHDGSASYTATGSFA